MPSFMAIVAPGLENISAKELKFYAKSLKTFGFEYSNINTIKGGVEFESSFEHGLLSNHFFFDCRVVDIELCYSGQI